jgi:hypothetical protein
MRLYAALAASLFAATLACGGGKAGVEANRCGQDPTFQPTLGIPTPALASARPAATVERAVVIGVWSDCVRPQTAAVRVGQLIQWQAREKGVAAEIVLEDGPSLGHVRHVLEYTFARSGTFRYHVRDSPAIGGTLVVSPE